MKLFEAFEALDALNEETFAVSDDGVEKLDTFMQDNEDSDDIVDVIDPEAETEEDIQDSYVGKVILDCSVCHSKIYKDKTEVTIDEEQQLANVGEDCPYCYTSDGFKVIGEVAPFADKDEDTVDVKEEEEEVVEESLTEAVGTLEKPMSAFAGTLSNVMTAHQDELAAISSKHDALAFLNYIEPEVKNKGYLSTVKEKVAKLPDFKVLTFLYNIILKGDGMGSKLESLTESHRGDRHRVTAELFDILSENGFDTDAEDVEDYVFAARDLVFEEVLADPSKSIREIVEQWFEDTKVNYPEDLEALTRFEEGLFGKKKDKKKPTQAPKAKSRKWQVYDCWNHLVVGEYDTRPEAEDSAASRGHDGRYRVQMSESVNIQVEDNLEEGIFGIKTKKEKEVDKRNAEMRARLQKETEKKIAKQQADWEEEQRQSNARSKEVQRQLDRYDAAKRNKSSGFNPSNTAYRGVNYSGGDYYSESINESSKSNALTRALHITSGVDSRDEAVSILHDIQNNCGIKSESETTEILIHGKKKAFALCVPSSDLAKVTKYANKKYPTLEFDVAFDFDIARLQENLEEGIFGNKKGKKTSQPVSTTKPKQWELFDIITHQTTGQKYDNRYEAEREAAAREKQTGHVCKVQMVESKSIKEDINNLSLDTDDTHMEMTSDENGKVTITTEPIEKTTTSDEVIVPVSDETVSEIENNNVENEEDVDFEEFDEASFDELGESYLKESFDNVVAFRTNGVTMSGNDLMVEGLIKFDSGNVKKTSFTFTAKDFLKEGLYRFIGKNNQLVESNSFELVGRIKDTKFICESLTERR